MKKEDFLKMIEELLFNTRATFPEHIQIALEKKLKLINLSSKFNSSCVGKDYNQNIGSLDYIVRCIEHILQPKRKFDVVVPSICIEDFIDKIFDYGLPDSNSTHRIYKGVSYNPNLLKYGEKIDNLDFFSYIKKSARKAVIFDASCYHALNILGNNQKLFINTEFSDFVCDEILNCVGTDKELKDNSQLRKKYLLRMNDFASCRNSEIISMYDVLTQNESKRIFQKNLDKGLDYCGAHTYKQGIDLRDYVKYKRNNSLFAKMYTPLVLAESLYAMKSLDCDTKLGPISETGFDSFISKMHSKLHFKQMQFVWYSRPFEKNSSPETSIYTKDTMDQVRKKLANNQPYAEWLQDVIGQFFYGEDQVFNMSKLEEQIECAIKQIEK